MFTIVYFKVSLLKLFTISLLEFLKKIVPAAPSPQPFLDCEILVDEPPAAKI